MPKKTFTTLLILFASILLSINATAQQERSVGGLDTKEEPPKLGLRVLEVLPTGLAHNAGLQPMDTIVKYGDFPVVDAAGYFAARDSYRKSPQSKIEIVYWRGPQRLVAMISPGTPGIKFKEHNPAAYRLDSLMQRLNVLIEMPAYLKEVPAFNGAMPSREKLVEEIEAAINKAAQDGLLTPAQILVARISAVADDAPDIAIAKQSELLKELISTQSLSFTDYLAYEVFFKHKRYRAAVPCFKRSLEANRSNAGSRLNLGIAYSHLRMFAESEAAADYVLKENIGLTPQGYTVAFQVKTTAALGLGEFAKALDYAEQAFRVKSESSYIMLLWQMAAALNGNLEKFYEVTAATQKALPTEYATFRASTDALEAYILFRNNQIDKAQALARKWAGAPNMDSHAGYWRQYPGSEEIVKVWKQLLAQN